MNELKEKVDILEKIVAKKVSKERERLEQLEIVVKAMSRKVLSLESELKDLKRKRKPSEEESIFKIKEIKRKEGDELQLIKRNTKLSDHKEVHPKEKNQPESEKEDWKPDDLKDSNIFNPSSFSSPKEKKDKQKKFEVKEGVFNCGQCDYKTKKKQLSKSTSQQIMKIIFVKSVTKSFHQS